ncbi:hypothetical protein AB0C84_35820 [Actinomadura sp. NPDC048955]|uniref:hypothetical protein n=1 Tax=Actinomadura sp. NPDC048955 TaxID=3158228 RepID=UPI0033F76898
MKDGSNSLEHLLNTARSGADGWCVALAAVGSMACRGSSQTETILAASCQSGLDHALAPTAAMRAGSTTMDLVRLRFLLSLGFDQGILSADASGRHDS